MMDQNISTTLIPIAGLQYFPGYLSQKQEDWLIKAIDRQTWLSDLKRRVQHYGYRYNYKARTVERAADFLGSLPEWINPLIQKILNEKLITKIPDQLIVNEYEPGQGISEHIDCVPCFDETIFSLSLGSACVMNFTRVEPLDKVSLLLEPGSLLILRGEARYNWKHGIIPHKTDIYRGQIIQRTRRISLTFRNILQNT
jgi:alkylated DNA repair dioxygenase AlkB